MRCRNATTASTCGMGFPAMFAPNTVGGHSICPRCMEFYLINRRREPFGGRPPPRVIRPCAATLWDNGFSSAR